MFIIQFRDLLAFLDLVIQIDPDFFDLTRWGVLNLTHLALRNAHPLKRPGPLLEHKENTRQRSQPDNHR